MGNRLLPVALATFLAAACRTPGPEDRIRADPAAFSLLPADIQDQVRRGQVDVGFSADAVRLALGEPDRRYERRTAAGVTEVWSYTGATTRPRPQIVFVQVPVRGGWVTGSETVWVNDVHEYERLRVEFESGRVRALERQKRQDDGRLDEERDSAAGTAAPGREGAIPASETLTGQVIRKPWTKSLESWDAGGSDYYVLDVGGTPVKARSAKEGVILRASTRVPFERFEAWVGKRVRVTGAYVEETPEPPPEPESFEQRPSLPGDGIPRRGSGFRVEAIEVVATTPPG